VADSASEKQKNNIHSRLCIEMTLIISAIFRQLFTMKLLGYFHVFLVSSSVHRCDTGRTIFRTRRIMTLSFLKWAKVKLTLDSVLWCKRLWKLLHVRYVVVFIQKQLDVNSNIEQIFDIGWHCEFD